MDNEDRYNKDEQKVLEQIDKNNKILQKFFVRNVKDKDIEKGNTLKKEER